MLILSKVGRPKVAAVPGASWVLVILTRRRRLQPRLSRLAIAGSRESHEAAGGLGQAAGQLLYLIMAAAGPGRSALRLGRRGSRGVGLP